MPKWLKVRLIVAAAGVLVVGLLVGGLVWWFSANGDRIAKDGREAETAGETFGATHAQSECVDDSLAQLGTCGSVDFMCEAMAKVRLQSCLSVARDDGTCKKAPTEIMKAATWANAECARRGQSGSQRCGRFLGGLAQACFPPGKAR
ncbi:MAG TPA: hypothetical protein VGG39_33255 [Polyangiaceae bacterium]|jgi:hypothetical protein